MVSTPCVSTNGSFLCKRGEISLVGTPLPFFQRRARAIEDFMKVRVTSQSFCTKQMFPFLRNGYNNFGSKKVTFTIPRCSGSSNSSSSEDESSPRVKAPFGYSRKDVLLIGLGVTVAGIGLKSGLEYVGVDPLQAGNVVQLVLVLGLTIGWISTYIFRVSNKEMTYAQQLRDYENKVMEKRLEGLTEAELEALLEQVEEEKRGLASGEKVN
ncbi:uncharacterized protein LOC132286289 [Cornus florida]|uniref:uncharacterized protein LOC132286289 n=1 Tax=Cornus florida TaxID=4283 RepID=UPI00289922C7|nr:uncharacterized protein LOC132286289 [Cornus florida]XP_059644588.1 uncharacterized protein LOC132286289 [Cornus florida]